MALPGNDGVAASVKALDRDVVLRELECLYALSAEKPMKLFTPSFSSSLLLADRGEGERWPDGEAGEMALFGWDDASAGEPEARIRSVMLASEARRKSLPVPLTCFDMNLSSHEELLVDSRGSPPAAEVKSRDFSLTAALVGVIPLALSRWTQEMSAFSTLTPFPLAAVRLTGELLRSSEFRKCSFLLSTFDTVLRVC